MEYFFYDKVIVTNKSMTAILAVIMILTYLSKKTLISI